MVDTLQITGKNTISFASGQRWQLYGQARPRGMSNPLTRNEAERELRNLPWEIRGHVLSQPGEHVLSKISFPFDIHGSSGADMEDALHDLIETLEEGALYIKTRGARGTKAQLVYKKDGASATSYKTIFYGLYDEGGARDVLGKEQMADKLIGAGLTLWSEPYWHPASATGLGSQIDVYNHDDSDSGHDNFFDLTAANIKGDVPGPTQILFVCPDDFAENVKWAYMVRRTVGTPSSFDHWLEAEDATSQTKWADAVDSGRSNGNIVSDATNTSGQIMHTIMTNLDHFKGKLAVFAGLWTDDIVNTKVKLRWYFGDLSREFDAGWKYLGKASTWQLLQLGTIHIGPEMFPPGDTFDRISIIVGYEKDATDTVKCDYIMLLPVDESAMFIELSSLVDYGTLLDSFEADAVQDFPAAYITDLSSGNMTGNAYVKGDYLALQPRDDNRIYLKFLAATNYDDPYSENIDSVNDHLEISIWHLPYYISPLE